MNLKYESQLNTFKSKLKKYVNECLSTRCSKSIRNYEKTSKNIFTNKLCFKQKELNITLWKMLINNDNFSNINYAAFGPIKSFWFLLINAINLANTGKYAFIGGNLEIL